MKLTKATLADPFPLYLSFLTNSMISTTDDAPRVALIGASGYATVYLDWLLEAHRQGKLKIVSLAVIPSDRQRPAVATLEKLGARIFESYESLFLPDSPRVDLCYIPTGIQWHARMAIAALRAGCNVLVEKPLAGSVADAQSVIDCEEQTGRWVAVGFQDMYTKETAWLKKSLVEGIIGKVSSISMLGAWPRPASYYRRNHWAGKLKADGAVVLDSPFNNAFAHFLNLSLYLAGEDIESSARAEVLSAHLYRAHDIESFDTATVTARSASGVRFWFGASHACQRPIEPVIRIVGDKGRIEWLHERSCEVRADGKGLDRRVVPKYAVTRSEMFEAVLSRLKNPNTPICSTDIAINHTALVEAIHRAAKIRAVSDSEVQPTPLESDDAIVPAIRDIESRLEQAFERSAALDNIRCEPVGV